MIPADPALGQMRSALTLEESFAIALLASLLQRFPPTLTTHQSLTDTPSQGFF
jgi:hypothetical protein